MLSISARLKYDTTFFVAFDASLLDAPASKLRVLDLTFECSVAPSTLLLALSSLPNLVSLSVKMRSITSYNEDLFIARIEGIEERFRHLEQLEITFYDHPPTCGRARSSFSSTTPSSSSFLRKTCDNFATLRPKETCDSSTRSRRSR